MMEINADDVHFVASLVHGLENPPFFILDTRRHPLHRGPYDVWAFQYPNGARYAFQVPIRMQNHPRVEITDLIDQEAANLELLAQAEFDYSPRPVTYSATFANHLRYPYIITSWIDGRPLEWTEKVPIQQSQRTYLLRQVASVLFKLVRCTFQHESDPTITADRFLTDKLDKKTMRIIRKQTEELTIQECMALRYLVRVISTIPNGIYHHDAPVSNQPCTVAASALVHDDLCASNILIDDDYRITGIINWSLTRRLPVRYALKLPRFLQVEPNPNDNTIEIPNDSTDETPHKFNSRYTCPPAPLRGSRRCFAHCISVLLMRSEPGSDIGAAAPLCADSEDIDWKHLILSAVLSTKLHQWLADRNYLLPATAAYWRDIKFQSWDDLLQREVILFCESHLLSFGSEARKKVALRTIKSAFEKGRGWEWLKRWFAVQFMKR